jgi:hypothetical protein
MVMYRLFCNLGGTLRTFALGENLFFAINDSMIIGTLACVLLEIKVKGEAINILYETTIIDNLGWLDTLAIATKHQAIGYGKQLFRQVQNFLWRKEVSTLKMTVIDANKHAYDMYLKHNFKLSKLLSTWYVKSFL